MRAWTKRDQDSTTENRPLGLRSPTRKKQAKKQPQTQVIPYEKDRTESSKRKAKSHGEAFPWLGLSPN